MAVWKVFWVDVEYWVGVAAERSGHAPVLLGEAIQRVLDDKSPAAAPGVGALTVTQNPDEDRPPFPLDLGTYPPAGLLWSRGELSIVPAGEVQAADLTDGGPSGDGGRPALLCSTDADKVPEADAAELGVAVYRLLIEPGILELDAGTLPVRRGPRVSLEEECWIVWLHALLRDPATLSPAEMTDFGWKPPAGERPRDAELSPTGFLLKGSRFEETFVPAGPGQLSVFFGRNGAGKSLAVSAVTETLGAMRTGGALVHDDSSVRPRCTLLLQAPVQESAPRLFAQVLAHLGWGPDTDMPFTVQRSCQQAIPAWNSATARPSDAAGMTVAQLADLPLARLRDALADAVSGWMPDGPSASSRVLGEALASSAVVAVTADWRVGLAVLPGTGDETLAAAASAYLAAARAADQAVFADELQQTLYRWACHLAGEQPSGPIVMATANLAHAGQWYGENHPESGWRQLGEALANELLRSIPRPVPFAPGRTTLQAGDAAAEEALLTLAEHLLEPAKNAAPGDRSHAFAWYPEHAIRLAALLEYEANQLVPRFVADAGAIKIRIAPPGEWHLRRAAATFTGGLDGEVAIDDLPSGLRTWSLAAISFALARLQAAAWTGTRADIDRTFRWEPGEHDAIYGSESGWTAKRNAFQNADPSSLTPHFPAAPNVVYVLDEPEAHLHLTAQRDIVATAAKLTEGSRGVLVATHSLSFLDTRPTTPQILTLDATPGKIRASSWTGLRDLTQHATTLGIPPSALALACRGVLVVEGPHDKEIIQRYGDVDLDKERIVIVPLLGADNAAGIAELEFLHALGIPIHLILDHVRAQVVQAIIDGKPIPGPTKEEASLSALHYALKTRQLRVNVLPFPRIDIIRAVPGAEINRALQQLGKPEFTGWADLDSRHATERKKNHKIKFKDTFKAVTGAEVGKIIPQLTNDDRRGPRSPELHGLLAKMLTFGPDGEGPGSGITTAS